MLIEDGTGSGRKVKVDGEYRMCVAGVVTTYVDHLNHDGFVWSIPFDAIAPSGATKFFHITYTGLYCLNVVRITISSTVAGVFRFLKVTGTPSGGSTITPVCMNLISTNILQALAQQAVSITGLTDAGLLLPFYLTANQTHNLELSTAWIIQPGASLAIQAPGAATINGNMVVAEQQNGD
jgi:hypothetical protein